jgi:hypothetical protein
MKIDSGGHAKLVEGDKQERGRKKKKVKSVAVV